MGRRSARKSAWSFAVSEDYALSRAEP